MTNVIPCSVQLQVPSKKKILEKLLFHQSKPSACSKYYLYPIDETVTTECFKIVPTCVFLLVTIYGHSVSTEFELFYSLEVLNNDIR